YWESPCSRPRSFSFPPFPAAPTRWRSRWWSAWRWGSASSRRSIRPGAPPNTIRWRRCVMNKPHLRLTGVHRHYGEGERLVRVLEAADLTVESGELVALVAPSGAGKSTLLHLCGLLESPQAGEIEI